MNDFALRKKLGQLFIIGFKGHSVTSRDAIVRDICQENLGGVILFDRHLATGDPDNNIINREQVQKLTSSLNRFASEQTKTNLIIAVDQEGGKVNRFKAQRGFPVTMEAYYYGAQDNTLATASAARQTASMLADMGINLNLAPVVDLNIFPDNPIIGKFGRSFSEKTSVVIEHCKAWILEHKKLNILTCLKHFPGHGSSKKDSHLNFVDISNTWQRKELLPYQDLIREGITDSVMLGHLFLRQIDPDWPMSLSPNAVQLLRKDLHFNGPILTDDMQMKAITNHYGLEEACAQSLKAGSDLIIIGNNLLYDADILIKIKEHIMQKIEKNELDPTRILDAYNRIMNLKTQIKKGVFHG